MINRRRTEHNVFKHLGENKLLIGISSWVIFFVFVVVVLELLI